MEHIIHAMTTETVPSFLKLYVSSVTVHVKAVLKQKKQLHLFL